jgi:ribose 5-phosphate isomerase A
MTQDEAKTLVGRRAAEFVEDGMAVGLGTGTTSVQFIHALGARVQAGLKIRCAASSESSFQLAQTLGIPVTTLPELPELDLYIDGADEVGPGLALIKGGGGALLREKIVASAAKKFICVVDSSKIVPQLGRFPLPIEVIQMALPLVVRKLRAIGLDPVQRKRKDGSFFVTDEKNFILDCLCGEIPDPERLAAQVRAIVGVVEHGLFLGMASLALIAGEDGVRELLP